ncbi:MAG: M56 family metallopeptidase, partial [Planctomycetota bacterium]
MDGLITLLNTTGKSFIGFAASMLVQSSVLIIILLVLDLILRKRVRAVFRYCIWMLVLVKLVMPTTLSLPTGFNYWFGNRLATVASEKVFAIKSAITTLPYFEPTSKTMSSEKIITVSPSVNYHQSVTGTTTKPDTTVTNAVPTASLEWQGLVFLIWLAAMITMILLLAQRIFFVRGIVSQSKNVSRKMVDVFEQCCEQMGVYRRVGLKISPVAISPSVCGLFRPTILIPQDLPGKLNSEHLKSILLHELAHIKRGDLWISLFQAILQIVYIYNPLLWIANAMIRKVREEAVDEMVLVAMGEQAEDYPEILLNISRLAFSRPALNLRLIGVVESKKALISRIKYIVSRPFPKSAKLGIVNLLVIIVVAAVLLPMAKAEPGSQIVKEAEQTSPSFKKYTFRRPDYSLKQYPQLVKPRTLDNPTPSPQDAVVFGWPIRWWSSQWAWHKNTNAVAIQQYDDFMRFFVNEPDKLHIWVKYFDVPIDPWRYPIVVMTYRAKETNTSFNKRSVLYLDDSSSPEYGGISVCSFPDIIADGREHTLTCDLRAMKPIDDIIGLTLGVHSNENGFASFDLIDLRFEAAQNKTQEVMDEERSYTVNVLDIDGRPIEDALVTVDAERSNWAKSEYTDASGVVTLTPYKTKSDRHMFRITKKNMIPVEIRDIPENDGPIVAVLEPAVTYGGFVIDEKGKPLANITVNIKVNYEAEGGLWTRKDAEVLTNEDGFWE